MALSEFQQAQKLLERHRSILIVTKKGWTGDSLAGGLALAEALVKAGKETEFVCQDFRPRADFGFLPTVKVKPRLDNNCRLVISINTQEFPVSEFSYERLPEKLNIYLNSAGRFKEKTLTTTTLGYRHDLIIVFNSPDLESLGELFQNHRDFFQETVKINIDHSSQNEYFGEINLIDLTAGAASEVGCRLIEEIDQRLIDEKIASWFLTGIIAATKNFRSFRLNPRTLEVASRLVAKGARREEIVNRLYQNRFLSTLKLWGRILERLNSDLEERLVWSRLAQEDFLETASSPGEISGVIDELIVSAPKSEVIIIFYQLKNDNFSEVKAIIHSPKKINVLRLVKKFNPRGNPETAKLNFSGRSLVEVENEVIIEVKKKMVAD